MAYKRKTYDEYQIQGYYSSAYGWEEVCAEETWSAAKQTLKDYCENEPGISFKIVKKRVKIEGGTEK